MWDLAMVIKNYPYISKIFTCEWFEDELKKDNKEMHLLAKQTKDNDGISLDHSSLQHMDYLEMLLENLDSEINLKKKHFITHLKNQYDTTLAEIEIGYLFKNMGFVLELEPPITDTEKAGKGEKTADIKIIMDDGLDVFVEVTTRAGPKKEDIYVFSWTDLLNKDADRLIHYLEGNHGVDLDEMEDIEIIDNSTIKIFTGKKYILLKLIDQERRVTLEIDNIITDEFIAKIGMENDELNGKLNVFHNPTKISAFTNRSPSDFRETIRRKSNQLSKSNPGIVALCLGPESNPAWTNVIKGFLNNIWDNDGNVIEIVDFSATSALLIYSRSNRNNRYEIRKELWVNPVAKYQLPDSIMQKFETSEVFLPELYDVSLSNPHPSD